MLTFYIKHAGKTLPKAPRNRLQRSKTELKSDRWPYRPSYPRKRVSTHRSRSENRDVTGHWITRFRLSRMMTPANGKLRPRGYSP
jgi:hypothetical protein